MVRPTNTTIPSKSSLLIAVALAIAALYFGRQIFIPVALALGLWDFAGGVLKAQDRVGSNCGHGVATSLSEGLLQVQRLSPPGTPSFDESKQTGFPEANENHQDDEEDLAGENSEAEGKEGHHRTRTVPAT